MTTQLNELFRDFGYLAAMIRNLDEARERSAFELPDEDQRANQFGLPDAFQHAYFEGITRLRRETPEFLYGMCFVHAYALFEQYLGLVLRVMLQAQPKILLRSAKQQKKDAEKKISYREVIGTLDSPGQLLSLIIDREIDCIMYMSIQDQLDTMRIRYGFSTLDESLDARIVQLSKIRNCVVHRGGRADTDLARLSRGFYQDGSRIDIDRNVVSRAITSYSQLASWIDEIAEDKYHFTDSMSFQKGD
jgi:hypothetical protein